MEWFVWKVSFTCFVALFVLNIYYTVASIATPRAKSSAALMMMTSAVTAAHSDADTSDAESASGTRRSTRKRAGSNLSDASEVSVEGTRKSTRTKK